jgi:hypothetical protein
MDAAVQLLTAATVSNVISTTLTTPPSQNASARWNQNDRLIQTKPAGNQFTVFMARLVNATGSDVSELMLSYSMGANTSNILYPEPVPGYRVYYSTTGDAGSWQVLPSLCNSNPGSVTATLPLAAWNPGALLFVLWADDNWITEGDAGYSIDNFMAVIPRTTGVISVQPQGTGTNQFEVFQTPDNGWSTTGVIGAAINLTNAAQLDAAVQLHAASNIQVALWKEYTAPPGNDGGNQIASQNLQLFTLQSRPVGNAANLLLATLQNDTGARVAGLRISYRFAAASSNITEDVPGFRAYWSLSGQPGTWHVIPELCTTNSTLVNHLLTVGDWRAGSMLFLLWADDNGPAGTTGALQEGAYTVDDFSATPVPEAVVPPVLLIYRPFPGSNINDLRWPDYAVSFDLEFTSLLEPPTWAPVPVAPQTFGGFVRAYLFNSQPGFFRLKSR